MYATKFLARMIVEGNDGSGFAPLFIRGSIPTISPKSHHWYMGVSMIFHWGRDRRAENRGLRPRAGWCSLGEAASPLPTSYGYGSAMSSPAGFVSDSRPPKCFPLLSALRMASSDTRILSIVDYNAAIRDRRPQCPNCVRPRIDKEIIRRRDSRGRI